LKNSRALIAFRRGGEITATKLLGIHWLAV
jgi:hypothetical protein